jgi:hypothetical protein
MTEHSFYTVVCMVCFVETWSDGWEGTRKKHDKMNRGILLEI